MEDLSIIIPVKKGDDSWKTLIGTLQSFKGTVGFEIILIGPDFADFANKGGKLVRYFHSDLSRAAKLNLGALAATKKFLWFLHADSKPAINCIDIIRSSLAKNSDALYYFDLHFLKDGPALMPLNAWGVSWRCKLFQLPFGDQGFFLKKSLFIFLGLFNEEAKYGEDHLLVWRAHQRKVPVMSCHAPIYTSARKYQMTGWMRTTIVHICLTIKQALPELWKKIIGKKIGAVAIFVKTPGFSPLKTRLAQTIGRELAEEFFLLSIKATEAVVIAAIKKSRGDLVAYWAVSEKDALSNSLWNSFPTLYQRPGELGDRLHTIYNQVLNRHHKVFLIGADLPHLPYPRLLEANEELNHCKYVMGETDDGGFYLFGGKNPISKATWNSVIYSSEHTARDLKKVLQSLGNAHFKNLAVEFDIDYAEDLKKLGEANINQGENLLPEQNDIIQWAKKIKPVQLVQTSP